MTAVVVSVGPGLVTGKVKGKGGSRKYFNKRNPPTHFAAAHTSAHELQVGDVAKINENGKQKAHTRSGFPTIVIGCGADACRRRVTSTAARSAGATASPAAGSRRPTVKCGAAWRRRPGVTSATVGRGWSKPRAARRCSARNQKRRVVAGRSPAGTVGSARVSGLAP